MKKPKDRESSIDNGGPKRLIPDADDVESDHMNPRMGEKLPELITSRAGNKKSKRLMPKSNGEDPRCKKLLGDKMKPKEMKSITSSKRPSRCIP